MTFTRRNGPAENTVVVVSRDMLRSSCGRMSELAAHQFR